MREFGEPNINGPSQAPAPGFPCQLPGLSSGPSAHGKASRQNLTALECFRQRAPVLSMFPCSRAKFKMGNGSQSCLFSLRIEMFMLMQYFQTRTVGCLPKVRDRAQIPAHSPYHHHRSHPRHHCHLLGIMCWAPGLAFCLYAPN